MILPRNNYLRLAMVALLTSGLLTLQACQTDAPLTRAEDTKSADDIERPDFNELPLDEPLRGNQRIPGATTGPTPGRLILDLLGPETEFPNRQLLKITYGEGESKTTAIALYSEVGLADDSVQGSRYRIELSRQVDSNQWRIDWLGSQVKCQTGRGQQDWGKEPCT